jgi:predicted kinase
MALMPSRPEPSAIARPTLFVMVGLPGAGKTSRAKEIENESGALRLTPDEWMIPLFGEPMADGKRFVLEGRFVWVAMRGLRIGINVVLDFGVWMKEERSALRFLARQAGADCRLVYLPIDEAEQRRRIVGRTDTAGVSTFPMTEDDLRQFGEEFAVPDEAELAMEEIDPPPAGFVSWTAWAAHRWPTSVEG